MPAPNEITAKQLLKTIGTAHAPLIVDLSIDEDHAAHPYLIPTARRHPHTDLKGLTDLIGTRRAVLVCQKGRKISQGAAAWLASVGSHAEYLAGGNLGWRDAPDSLRIPVAAMRGPLWVTRHRPKIDRIACPWLIRRFIDPCARILFVSPSEVEAVAKRFGATPFDTNTAPFTHHGDRCTFDAFLAYFELRSPALERLATVIRGADTGEWNAHPACAGLLAISVGLSRLHKSDQDQLDDGMILYDALYRWARDGFEETHADGAAA
ncbi:MAG: chromate resistance protein ChrB domain-containing protein [Pseudomonadota bacterium]